VLRIPFPLTTHPSRKQGKGKPRKNKRVPVFKHRKPKKGEKSRSFILCLLLLKIFDENKMVSINDPFPTNMIPILPSGPPFPFFGGGGTEGTAVP
jgi:hypothetical protein